MFSFFFLWVVYPIPSLKLIKGIGYFARGLSRQVDSITGPSHDRRIAGTTLPAIAGSCLEKASFAGHSPVVCRARPNSRVIKPITIPERVWPRSIYVAVSVPLLFLRPIDGAHKAQHAVLLREQRLEVIERDAGRKKRPWR